jgi:transcriptional regulator with XRE-family HTH domain
MTQTEIHGNRVLALRRALGVSGPELARRARVSRDALHRIETHRLDREPLVATMRRIAQALELGALADVYVIDGDGGLLGALERRRPAARPPQLPTMDTEAAADRWAAVMGPLPEPERLMLAELGADTGPGLRAGVRAIRDWLIAHDGAGAVTLGRLRSLARTWVAACAPDVGEALERLDAALQEHRRPAEPEPAPHRPRLLGSRGR